MINFNEGNVKMFESVYVLRTHSLFSVTISGSVGRTKTSILESLFISHCGSAVKNIHGQRFL